MINNIKVKNKKTVNRNDRFLQGYLCAVAALIEKDGGVATQTKELFREGVGEYDLNKMRKSGIDEYDITIFKKYRKELI